MALQSKARNTGPRTRFRTRNLSPGLVTSTTQLWQRKVSTGQILVDTGLTARVVSLPSYESMTDVVTPGFAQAQANGTLVNNPMTKVLHQETPGSKGFKVNYTIDDAYSEFFRTNATARLLGPIPPVGAQRVNVENLQNLCRTAALAGVDSSDMQGLVSIAEIGKTISLLTNPVKGLLRAMRDYEKRIQQGIRSKFADAYWRGVRTRTLNGTRRSKRSGVERAIKRSYRAESVGDFLANSLLMFNLAIKPTLMDIDAILHKIPQREEIPRRSSRETKTDSASWSETISHLTVDGNTFICRYDHTEEVTVRATVIYVDNFQVEKHFGTRLADVPEAAWELIPFSFLVDYVANIGDFLGALRAQSFANVINCSTVTTIKETCKRVVTGFVPVPPYNVVDISPLGEDGTMSHTTKTRNPAAFSAQFAYLPVQVGFKTPSHLQNVLGLLTKQLVRMSRDA